MDGALFLPVAIAAALVGIAAFSLRESWRMAQAGRLVVRGRYAEAQAAAERLERSWARIFPSIRRGARYTRASTLHLRGDQEGALATLASLRAVSGAAPWIYAVSSLEASCLVVLGRDLARAKTLLEEAARIRRPEEDLLLLALAELGLGDAERAARLFDDAGTTRSAQSGLRHEQRHQGIVFHALRGAYLVAAGRGDDAKTDLELASRSGFENVYVMRARALLEALAPESVAEGPSSLAPVVASS